MNNKLCLVLLGLLLVLAVIASAADGQEDSETRVVRNVNPKRNKHMKRRPKRRGGKKKFRMKKGKGKKSKGGKIKKNIKGRKRSQRQVNDVCVTSLTTVLKRQKLVLNFMKQKSRIEKQQEISMKKSNKKGLFAPIALKLVSFGGGNKSNPECGGKTDSDGAKQLKNLTTTLFECEKEVNKSCNPANFPKPNMTKLTACNSSANQFESKVQECLKISAAAEACSCWSSSDMSSYSEAVKDCKMTTDSDAGKAGLSACKSAFSKCRKFEDDVIYSMKACSASPDKLAEKAAALSKNKAAMDSVKKKIAALTGSRRLKRAPATDCKSIIELIKECEIIFSVLLFNYSLISCLCCC